jgi:hypothetical protein
VLVGQFLSACRSSVKTSYFKVTCAVPIFDAFSSRSLLALEPAALVPTDYGKAQFMDD